MPKQPVADAAELVAWFTGRLPDGWFTVAPEVTVDRDEILVVGTLPEPEHAKDADADTRRAASAARIQGFREDTREQRMRVADEAEHRFGRKVAWGARCGDHGLVFTHLSVPVMTRLRMSERPRARHPRRRRRGPEPQRCPRLVRAPREGAPGRVGRGAA